MNRTLSLAVATVLLAAFPAFLALPALVPGIDSLVGLLAGIASLYLGLQLWCGEPADA